MEILTIVILFIVVCVLWFSFIRVKEQLADLEHEYLRLKNEIETQKEINYINHEFLKDYISSFRQSINKILCMEINDLKK